MSVKQDQRGIVGGYAPLDSGLLVPVAYLPLSKLPGYEFDYAQITSPVNVTATSEATATTLITGASVAYDGSTVVMIEAYAPYVQPSLSTYTDLLMVLLDGSTVIGTVGIFSWPSNAASQREPYHMLFRVTPTAGSHTYSLRGYKGAGTPVFAAGTGGSGSLHVPAFLRITRV